MTDDDIMEISSEHGQAGVDEIDIDIDFTTAQVDEDYVLPDVISGADYGQEAHLSPSMAMHNDDIMIDDDNASYPMDDADASKHDEDLGMEPEPMSFAAEDIIEDSSRDIQGTTGIVDEDHDVGLFFGQSDVHDHETTTIDFAHHLENTVYHEDGLPVVEETTAVKPSLKISESVIEDTRYEETISSPHRVQEEATGHSSDKVQTELSQHVSLSLDPSDEHSHQEEPVPNVSTPSSSRYDISTAHNIKVVYREVEYALFSQSASDDTDSFFLSDLTIVDKPFRDFFGAIREIIRDDLADEEELTLSIEELGLDTEEASSSIAGVTLAHILDVHQKLLHNNGTDAGTDLYLILSTRVNFTRRLQSLQEGAAQGKTTLQLLGISVNEDNVEDLDMPEEVDSEEEPYIEAGGLTENFDNSQAPDDEDKDGVQPVAGDSVPLAEDGENTRTTKQYEEEYVSEHDGRSRDQDRELYLESLEEQLEKPSEEQPEEDLEEQPEAQREEKFEERSAERPEDKVQEDLHGEYDEHTVQSHTKHEDYQETTHHLQEELDLPETGAATPLLTQYKPNANTVDKLRASATPEQSLAHEASDILPSTDVVIEGENEEDDLIDYSDDEVEPSDQNVSGDHNPASIGIADKPPATDHEESQEAVSEQSEQTRTRENPDQGPSNEDNDGGLEEYEIDDEYDTNNQHDGTGDNLEYATVQSDVGLATDDSHIDTINGQVDHDEPAFWQEIETGAETFGDVDGFETYTAVASAKSNEMNSQEHLHDLAQALDEDLDVAGDVTNDVENLLPQSGSSSLGAIDTAESSITLEQEDPQIGGEVDDWALNKLKENGQDLVPSGSPGTEQKDEIDYEDDEVENEEDPAVHGFDTPLLTEELPNVNGKRTIAEVDAVNSATTNVAKRRRSS